MRPLPSWKIAALPSLLAFVLAGCSVPIDLSQTTTIPIDAQSGAPLSMSSTSTFDLAQQSQVSSELKAVTSLQVSQVVVSISNIQADNQASEVSGTITISDPTDPSWTPITLAYTNAPVSEGAMVDLTPNAGDVSRLSALLLSKKEFAQESAATVNTLPAHFDLTSRFQVIAYVDVARL